MLQSRPQRDLLCNINFTFQVTNLFNNFNHFFYKNGLPLGKTPSI